MKTLAFAVAAALAASAFSTDAAAQTGTADGQDLSVHISLLGLANLDVTPQAPAALSNVAVADDVVNSLPSLTVPGALLSLSTGLLSAEAQYADGGTSGVGGSVSVANLNISAVNLLGSPLLAVSAGAVVSTSIVTGYCPSTPGIQSVGPLDDMILTTSFDSGNLFPIPVDGTPIDGVWLTDLTISILGINVPNLPTNPAPNTGINLNVLGIAGATLVLNEQTITGDGTNWSAKSSNAVHLTLNVAGLITGDVVIGHSDAKLSCMN